LTKRQSIEIIEINFYFGFGTESALIKVMTKKQIIKQIRWVKNSKGELVPALPLSIVLRYGSIARKILDHVATSTTVHPI